MWKVLYRFCNPHKKVNANVAVLAYDAQLPDVTADRGQYKIIAYVLAMLCHI